MAIALTPLEDIDAPASNNEHAELIKALDGLPKKAASFVVPYVEDELKKYKKALQTAANRFGLSVRFGSDTAVAADPATGAVASTTVQAKVVPKQSTAGRPVSGPAPVDENGVELSAADAAAAAK